MLKIPHSPPHPPLCLQNRSTYLLIISSIIPIMKPSWRTQQSPSWLQAAMYFPIPIAHSSWPSWYSLSLSCPYMNPLLPLRANSNLIPMASTNTTLCPLWLWFYWVCSLIWPWNNCITLNVCIHFLLSSIVNTEERDLTLIPLFIPYTIEYNNMFVNI